MKMGSAASVSFPTSSKDSFDLPASSKSYLEYDDHDDVSDIKFELDSSVINGHDLNQIRNELCRLVNIKERYVNCDKKMLSEIVKLCKGNKSIQENFSIYIKDVMSLISSSKAVTESLNVMIYLCRCDGSRQDNPDIDPLSDSNNNMKNIEELGMWGACRIVVSILNDYGESSGNIAELGCWLIFCLALCDCNRDYLGQIGACSIVSKMLKIYGEQLTNVADAAFWAIYRLSFRNSSNKTKLRSCFTCELVVLTLKNLGNNVHIAQSGCLAISNLCAYHSVCSELLGECGACDTLLEILKLHGFSNINVAEAGCLAICNLTYNESNQYRLSSKCDILTQLWHQYSQINTTIYNCRNIIQLIQLY